MSLTITQLCTLPQLSTRFLAGRAGGVRPVTWAHTCELPEPWEWLGTGDLLLSDGYSFPSSADAQVAFIRRLAEANLAGLVLAEGLHAAPLTRRAAEAADELEFPVLETAYAVPFATVAKTVSDSNSQDSSRRLHKILRIYDIVRRRSSNGLLAQLQAEIAIDLAVLDLGSGQRLLDQTPVPDGLLEAVGLALARHRGRLPAFSRVAHGSQVALVLPISEESKVVLVAVPGDSDVAVDLIVLQHVASIAGLEAERHATQMLRRRLSGARTFQRLLDGAFEPSTARARIAQHGLGEGPWLTLAHRADEADLDRIQARLVQLGCPHLFLPTQWGLLILIDDRDDAELDKLRSGLVSTWLDADRRSQGLRDEPAVGVSQRVLSASRVPDAVREARLALEGAIASGQSVVRYGTHKLMFMPSTVADGERAVSNVLGEVIAYDLKNETDLMGTLGAYLDSNRSVQQCASVLGIHKQTVLYRMRRVEELTGRRIQHVSDLSELYFAHRTWRLLLSGPAPAARTEEFS